MRVDGEGVVCPLIEPAKTVGGGFRLKYRIKERCKNCNRPNVIQVYEGLTLEEMNEIDACRCGERS